MQVENDFFMWLSVNECLWLLMLQNHSECFLYGISVRQACVTYYLDIIRYMSYLCNVSSKTVYCHIIFVQCGHAMEIFCCVTLAVSNFYIF